MPDPLARVDEFCDAVAAAIASQWAPVAPNEVITDYAPDIGLSVDEPDTLITGRKVYVWPIGYAAPETIDRAELLKQFTCGVVIVERYTTTAKSPPKAWMRERIRFVEQLVFNVLRNPNLTLLDALVPAPEEAGVIDVVFDLDILIEHRAFWSQGTFTFQEVTEYGS